MKGTIRLITAILSFIVGGVFSCLYSLQVKELYYNEWGRTSFKLPDFIQGEFYSIVFCFLLGFGLVWLIHFLVTYIIEGYKGEA